MEKEEKGGESAPVFGLMLGGDVIPKPRIWSLFPTPLTGAQWKAAIGFGRL
jgi:hypothetical protein